MSWEQRYRQSLDYPYLILEALRDVRRRRAGIGVIVFRDQLAELRAALQALVDILPSKVRGRLGAVPESLGEIDDYIQVIVDELHRTPGLLPTKKILTGGELEDEQP